MKGDANFGVVVVASNCAADVSFSSPSMHVLYSTFENVQAGMPFQISVSESGTAAMYAITLDSDPDFTGLMPNTVIVKISTDGELSMSPTEVAFTPHDWNVAKVTVVSAVDDSLAEEFERVSIFHSADSATARFFSKLDEKQRVSVAWAGIAGVDAEFTIGYCASFEATGLVADIAAGSRVFQVSADPTAVISAGTSILIGKTIVDVEEVQRAEHLLSTKNLS